MSTDTSNAATASEADGNTEHLTKKGLFAVRTIVIASIIAAVVIGLLLVFSAINTYLVMLMLFATLLVGAIVQYVRHHYVDVFVIPAVALVALVLMDLLDLAWSFWSYLTDEYDGLGPHLAVVLGWGVIPLLVALAIGFLLVQWVKRTEMTFVAKHRRRFYLSAVVLGLIVFLMLQSGFLGWILPLTMVFLSWGLATVGLALFVVLLVRFKSIYKFDKDGQVYIYDGQVVDMTTWQPPSENDKARRALSGLVALSMFGFVLCAALAVGMSMEKLPH